MKRRVYSHHKLPPSTEVIQNAVSHNLFVVLVKLKCIFNQNKMKMSGVLYQDLEQFGGLVGCVCGKRAKSSVHKLQQRNVVCYLRNAINAKDTLTSIQRGCC